MCFWQKYLESTRVRCDKQDQVCKLGWGGVVSCPRDRLWVLLKPLPASGDHIHENYSESIHSLHPWLCLLIYLRAFYCLPSCYHFLSFSLNIWFGHTYDTPCVCWSWSRLQHLRQIFPCLPPTPSPGPVSTLTGTWARPGDGVRRYSAWNTETKRTKEQTCLWISTMVKRWTRFF